MQRLSLEELLFCAVRICMHQNGAGDYFCRAFLPRFLHTNCRLHCWRAMLRSIMSSSSGRLKMLQECSSRLDFSGAPSNSHIRHHKIGQSLCLNSPTLSGFGLYIATWRQRLCRLSGGKVINLTMWGLSSYNRRWH